jgi:integrase
MRKGELLALHWNDIDFDQKLLQVRRTVTYLPAAQGEKHSFQETQPKTRSSRRSISLPQFVIDVLHQHRSRQLEMRLQEREHWQDHGLVFCSRKGTYYGITTLARQFKRLLRKAGLPSMRFHNLRHSAATILLSMGVHPKVVQELLGHSTIRMTMDLYSHALPGLQREAMNTSHQLFCMEQKEVIQDVEVLLSRLLSKGCVNRVKMHF